MRRRALAGLLAAPSLAQAQPRLPPRRIGYLIAISLDPRIISLRILRERWQAQGFVEGESVLLRSAEGDPARLPGLVQALIARDVGVIIAVGPEALRAAFAGTRTLPIIGIDLETDPIAAGMAQSYARPGGNVTGLFLDQPSLAGKWLELLREIMPGLARVGLLWDPSTGPGQRDAALAAARAQGLATAVIDWRATPDPAAALAPLADGRTGLIALTAPGFLPVAAAFGTAAERHRLPLVVGLRLHLVGGVLMSYGPDQVTHFGRAMGFVERILAGQKPGDLPIELPTRYQLAIDARVARRIGVSLPMTLLASAEEIIE